MQISPVERAPLSGIIFYDGRESRVYIFIVPLRMIEQRDVLARTHGRFSAGFVRPRARPSGECSPAERSLVFLPLFRPLDPPREKTSSPRSGQSRCLSSSSRVLGDECQKTSSFARASCKSLRKNGAGKGWLGESAC